LRSVVEKLFCPLTFLISDTPLKCRTSRTNCDEC
jgi:hypothetical protein